MNGDERWMKKQADLAATALMIGSLLDVAADYAKELVDNDDALGPEVAIIADGLNFAVAAAAQIVDVVMDRVKARLEEMRT